MAPEAPARVTRLRRHLVAGLLIWIPIFVTVFVIRFIVDLMDRTLLLLPASWRPEALVGFHIPGLGLLLSFVVLLITGIAVGNLIGRRLVRWWDELMRRIPFVRSIYSGTKTFAETVLSGKGQAFSKVVLLEYPRQGLWSIGFLSATGVREVDYRVGEELWCVFVPTTPNPTSGFIMMVRACDVIVLDMTVDQAMRMIVTLGVVVPDWRPGQPLPGASAAART